MTFHDETRIALAILAGLGVIAISAAYFRKVTSLTAYLDVRHPEYLNRPDLLPRDSTKWWYYGGYDRTQKLRSSRLNDLVLSAAPRKCIGHEPKLDALLLEVRCVIVVWIIVWTLAMISLFSLPFQPPALHPYYPWPLDLVRPPS